jgi:1,4-dihydroxy-2-naphthoate octaprenyltransferase
MGEVPRSSFAAGLWRLADPKISLASFSAMFLGACAAGRDGPLSSLWLLLTVLGIFAIEVAKNASGDIFDFDSGTDLAVGPEDRSPFSGGKRVLVDGLLTRRQTAGIAAVAYALGIAAGLAIAAFREPRVLALGVLGVAAAFFYHAPPLRLSYRGIGEITVGLCYGPLLTAGTYLVQRGEIPREVLWISLPLGMMIADFLLINEFPDASADAQSEKRTVVVRLGRRRASVLFALVAATAFSLLLCLPLLGVERGVWLGMVGVIPAIRAGRLLRAHPEQTPQVVPAQALTLLSFLLLSLGCGLGLVLFR